MITLIHGDCLEEMSTIKDNSIDMIMADLPYGKTQCRWDTIIPFNSYVQFYKGDEKSRIMYEDEFILYKIEQGCPLYEARLIFKEEKKLGLWDHFKRITKDRSPILLFGTEPFSSQLRLSNIKMFKYDWAWEKTHATGFLNAKKQPMRDSEIISVFYKKAPKYNPIKTTGHKRKAATRGNVESECYGDAVKTVSYDSTERYPRCIIKFPSDKQKDGGYHPTQKPVALAEYFIKTYTNEGDTILDCTSGGATFGIAAIKTNRKSILIEKDDFNFEIGRNRINNFLMERSAQSV